MLQCHYQFIMYIYSTNEIPPTQIILEKIDQDPLDTSINTHDYPASHLSVENQQCRLDYAVDDVADSHCAAT